MKVAVICEFSGIVRDAFIARGHDAVSCDLLPSDRPGPHIQGDCLAHDWTGYDLLICHPPCTYLSNAGVCWLYRQPDRWGKMEDAADFFLELWSLPAERVAIENPKMHRHARNRIGLDAPQIVHPWQFGHETRKETHLWTRGLPPLEPTNVVNPKARGQCVRKSGDRAGRVYNYYHHQGKTSHDRARTFAGIADAMADQWGALCAVS